MNSQELRALQEAYMDVYELDEDGWQPPTQKKADKMMKQASKLHRTASERGEPGNPEAEKKHTQASKIYFMSRRMSDKATARDKEAARKEFVKEDLYDIILSHLLDEGYADTQEQAEVIMVNMSEDWRESICEATVLDEGEKPFPYEKVKEKQVALRDKGSAGLDRRMKMGLAVRRAKEAGKKGGSQQDAGKDWYHGK